METAPHNVAQQDTSSHLSEQEINAIINDQANQITDQANQITDQANQINKLHSELNCLKEQFKLLKHKQYAKSSEKQNTLQLSLFDESDEESQVEPKSGEKTEHISYVRRKANRKEKNIDTRDLPREKRYIDLSEEEKQCGCGHSLEKFGEESREELEFEPAKLKVIEHIRSKYTCRQCQTVKMPKAIELPLSKSKAGSGLLAEIILNKYSYHLPLYRQSKMLATHQIMIPDNTLGAWVMKCAEQLKPLGAALFEQLAQVNVLQADETPVNVLAPNKKGYMWLYHSYLPGKRFVIFDFNLSRSGAVVNERLKDFKGLLQTDGYSGYNTQRKRDEVITLGCWDHARRKFAEVVKACGKNKSGKAGKVLEKIAKLYEIEADIKDLAFEVRQQRRQEKAKPKLNALYEFIEKINAPPKSLLGVAVTYCRNQWGELIRYIEHGEAQISNCWIENQVRPFAVGKRNWLFVGNEASASKAALLYSLLQSCELNQVDPRAYLKYVLSQVHPLRRKEVDPSTLLPHTIDRALLK